MFHIFHLAVSLILPSSPSLPLARLYLPRVAKIEERHEDTARAGSSRSRREGVGGATRRRVSA